MGTRHILLYERITKSRLDRFLNAFKQEALDLSYLDGQNISIRLISCLNVDAVLNNSGMFDHEFRREIWESIDVPDIEVLYPFYHLLTDIDVYLIKLYRLQNLQLLDHALISDYKNIAVGYLDSVLRKMMNDQT